MAPTDLIGCCICRETAVVDRSPDLCIPVLWHWISPLAENDSTPVHEFGTLCEDCAITHWAQKEPMGTETE